MLLPPETPEIIKYRCNICGGNNTLESQKFHRELSLCVQCGSNARFRGIINALAKTLNQKDERPLQEWTPQKNVVGVGMSDWDGYAKLLSEKFNYENSYYDRAPQLDIQNLTSSQLGAYDFVISSDVFEHILPPLQHAFDNMFSLLKPGGRLIFSVPYTRSSKTVEHFKEINDFEILNFKGENVLVNRSKSGSLQIYDDLVFHGGEGSTLEMRIYCESDVVNRLSLSGFDHITIYEQPLLPIGYYWPELRSGNPNISSIYAYIISAIKPLTV